MEILSYNKLKQMSCNPIKLYPGFYIGEIGFCTDYSSYHYDLSVCIKDRLITISDIYNDYLLYCDKYRGYALELYLVQRIGCILTYPGTNKTYLNYDENLMMSDDEIELLSDSNYEHSLSKCVDNIDERIKLKRCVLNNKWIFNKD